MTFSIAARCDETGEYGAAIASATPCVGTICLWMQAGVGVVCTQAWTNPYLGKYALSALSRYKTTTQAMQYALAKDANAFLRQVGLVGTQGNGAAWTGSQCDDVYSHRTGSGYSIQGNMLASSDVIEVMTDTYLAKRELPFADRLLAVLVAGQHAGGDKRGQQSAALAIIGKHPWRALDIRVDEHEQPVSELARILEVAKAQFLPFAESLPNEKGENAPNIQTIKSMMKKKPEYRG